MKNLKLNVLLLVTSLLIGLTFNSCQKEPTACINASKTTANVGEKITLSNCSKDAFAYEWSFSNGDKLTSENVDYTMNSPGSRTVSLKVFSKNGKKSDETSVSLTANEYTKEQFLTRKSWKLVALTIYPAIDLYGDGSYWVTNYYAEMDYCEKDNITTFNSNWSYVIDEGSIKCDYGDPQTVDSGTWMPNTVYTEITLFMSGGYNATYQIQTLNETTLVLTYSDSGYSGTQTYSNQ